MLESRIFTYDGISSEDMGVELVQAGAGTFNESLFSSRTVNTQKVPGSDYPIFRSIDNDPLSFPVTLWIRDWQSKNNLRAISRWLRQKEYKPFIVESNTDQIYYLIFNGDTNLEHNGNQEGTVTLTALCDSPFSYSRPLTNTLQVRGNQSLSLYNEGDEKVRPQMIITKIGDGNISITNNRNNQTFILNNLLNNEIIRVNCEFEEIQSSLEQSNNRYLLNNHNDVWLDFDFNQFEETIFTFNGDFNIEFTFEYKYLNQDRPIYF